METNRGQEVDLMRFYPSAKRTAAVRGTVDERIRRISKQFGQEFFDGDRVYGYGGYYYHPRFWTETVRLFADHYKLAEDASILDIGCAKGFLLFDFMQLMPGATLYGIDVSQYAIENCKEEARPFLQVGNALELSFENESVDLVISINTIHNLSRSGCIEALREIERVRRGHAFVMVDGWRSDREKELLDQWVLTPETMLHVDDWRKLFEEAGYTGDYWFWSTEG